MSIFGNVHEWTFAKSMRGHLFPAGHSAPLPCCSHVLQSMFCQRLWVVKFQQILLVGYFHYSVMFNINLRSLHFFHSVGSSNFLKDFFILLPISIQFCPKTLSYYSVFDFCHNAWVKNDIMVKHSKIVVWNFMVYSHQRVHSVHKTAFLRQNGAECLQNTHSFPLIPHAKWCRFVYASYAHRMVWIHLNFMVSFSVCRINHYRYYRFSVKYGNTDFSVPSPSFKCHSFNFC
jgi:hypothetical protein